VSEILKYRIPGNPRIEQTGNFRELKSIREANGFVISSYLKDKFFEFSPSTVPFPSANFNCVEPSIIDKEKYLIVAKSFLHSIVEKKIKKAVLSRIKKVPFDENKINHLFDALCDAYPTAFVYLISGLEVGTWVGASPETLLHVSANSAFTMSLAGTKPLTKKATPWGEKEQREQAYVTDFIIEKLSSQGIKNLEITGPYDLEAGPVLHLRTDINFDIENQKSIDIALKLHPTPAVSGFPQKESIDLINSKELHDREFYTGMIGFIAQNSASLYVNLRCCQVQKGHAYLYLGGGFTADSVPELEWEETENKSRTLLNIIETL
jgi:isochorismate synthase